MDLSSTIRHFNSLQLLPLQLSFSSVSVSPFNPLLKSTSPPHRSARICTVAVSGELHSSQARTEAMANDSANGPQRLLNELVAHKKVAFPEKQFPPRRLILTPPLDDAKIIQRFLNSPQLSLKAFPLLSSCLPACRLNNADQIWIEEYLLEAKQALGYPLEPSDNLGVDNPGKYFDKLLYLAFQHPFDKGERTKARHVSNGHSRLWFLGQYVLELAFAEYFLQRYPRESPGPMRERVNALIGKWNLPKWIKAASLQNLVFPYDDIDKLKRHDKEPPVRSVFWALFGTIYLCFGMPEVYRVLFEVIGIDPEDKYCQPKLRRQLDDVDVVSVEFEEQLSWQEVAAYEPPHDALFVHPRLFRACVPPGMHRFRGNIWDFDYRLQVMEILGYPLQMIDNMPEIIEARNIELGLGLQLCFLHPSKYKFEHPRFCFDRLEYVGQKIQDLVMAERLLIKHIDAPGKWLQEKHGRLLLNKLCGRYLREKHLHRFIIYGENVEEKYEHNRRLKNPSTTSVQQAIHGLSYCVYGKPDVRRLMFEVFDFERVMPKPV